MHGPKMFLHGQNRYYLICDNKEDLELGVWYTSVIPETWEAGESQVQGRPWQLSGTVSK